VAQEKRPLPEVPGVHRGDFDFGLVVAPSQLMDPRAAGVVKGAGPETAVAQLICKKCGCSLYFDAQKIGIPLPK
jgi:hypothetical protein